MTIPTKQARCCGERWDLWRGHPYAGVEAHTLLNADVTRLNELRVPAIEARVHADLETGRDQELVAELEALTNEYLLNERLRSQQMLALYRAGRQAEALRAYEKTRVDLVEMGLAPSADLRELEQRILDQDATLTLDERPTVRLASVLVADVADPDQLAGLLPDERHRVISSHAAALDRAVTANAGRVFSQRGSALYAWFAEASAAASAAADVQLATEELQPRLRIAIATGDVEDTGGEEISGPPVSRAAALVAVTHGGQVLLSSDAHAALTSSGIPGFGIRSLGPHTIPGLLEGELVYQLESGDFPALRIGEVPPPLPISERGVVGYELRDELGVGPFGVVHRAYQPSIGREVAVKVIRPEFANDMSFIRRFEVEAQLVARLEHPNIVPLHDYWREPEGAFLVMRWLRGREPQRAARHGPALDGRDRSSDRDPARATSALADLGPGHRDGPTRGTADRHRSRDLLLRPAQPLAARHQREHERAPASVLPQGHRPLTVCTRGPRRRCPCAQHAATQDARMAHTRRGPQRPSTIWQTRQCCNDSLNPSSTRRRETRTRGCGPSVSSTPTISTAEPMRPVRSSTLFV